MSAGAVVPPPCGERVVRVEALVIGGGQAGLAVGQQLAQRDVDVLILDAERRVGDAWRRRWDSLRLFTPAAYCGLPGMVFPAPPAHLPDKDEVADYLARYAERFDLPVRANTRVTSLARDGARWVARTACGCRYEAESVVVATGPFQRPNVPPLAARLAPAIVQLHSSRYRSPFDLPDGPALVVGAGNSGAQIALELARYRPVWLSGRDPVQLPRRALGRDLFDWVWPLARHATADTPLGRRLRARPGGDVRIGIPSRMLHDAGVARVGRVTEVLDGRPVCDGAPLDPRVVVWCTGFTTDHAWIDAPVCDARGRPRHVRGVATDAPGLYFVGLRFQHRLTSSLLGGVGEDAAYVAACVARRAGVPV